MDNGLARTESTQTELQALAAKLNQLVEVARKLDAENRTLKSVQAELLDERAALSGKNEQARVRIEAMISRLKAMEQHL